MNIFVHFRTNPSYVPTIFQLLDDENEQSGTKKPEPKNKRNVKVSAKQIEGKLL
jgi:hypothetical protein